MRSQKEIKRVRPIMRNAIMAGLAKIDYCTSKNVEKTLKVAMREFWYGANAQKSLLAGFEFIINADRWSKTAMKAAVENWNANSGR